MRYTEETIEELRKRWEKPLLKPGSFARDENGEVKGGEPQPIDEKGWRLESKGTSEKKIVEIERIETFQDLLTTRLEEIEAVLLPEIDKIDKSLDWEEKQGKYQAAWNNTSQGIFLRTLENLRDYGLNDFYNVFFEKPIHQGIAVDLRGADCCFARFDGAVCELAHFDGAGCVGAHFDGADCRFAHFEDAVCSRAHFDGADCRFARFDGAYCRFVHFDGAYCEDTNFDDANCLRAHFDGADCSLAYFDGADCRDANFDGANCIGANFNGAVLRGVNYRNSKLINATFEKAKVDSNTHFDKTLRDEKERGEDFDWSSMVETYIQIKNAFKNRGYYDEAGNYYFREMHCRRMALGAWWKHPIELLKEYTLGYGEKPLWMVGWMIIAIEYFGLGYLFGGGVVNQLGQSIRWERINSLYFSAVTFATLGYGDFAPVALGAKIVSVIEAMLGLIFVSLFVVSMARKTIRD